MTYIEHMNQLWRSALLSPMPASEIALFAYLVNESNKRYWKMVCVLHNKNMWESVPVTHPTARGSRIARSDRISNAEPTPNMCIITDILHTASAIGGHARIVWHADNTYPRGIYHCLILDRI